MSLFYRKTPWLSTGKPDRVLTGAEKSATLRKNAKERIKLPQLHEFTFPSCDGVHEIYVRKWTPDGEPRGVVQIEHGVLEYIQRYDGFMQFLAQHGFVAAGDDHLGHGRSVKDETELGWFSEENGWSMVVGDIHRLHNRLKEEYPNVPMFLFGHSMGSFLVRTYSVLNGEELDGLIVCGTGNQAAPLLLAGKAAAKLEILRHGVRHRSQRLNDLIFGSYNVKFKESRTQNDWLCRDEAIVDAYEADPLCGGIPTVGLIYEMMKGLIFVTDKKNVSRMPKDLPVFFISGAADPVGEQGKGVMKAYRLFLDSGLKDVSLKLYPEGRHEILNELNKEEVYSDVLEWLEKKL